tara:strand:- start:296 stop:583 length:288 start_codon:yes stop_codon:yes gene_type:complete
MSTSDTNNNLLREMLGKGSAEVFTTSAQTGKDFYLIHFPVQSTISSLTVANFTNANNLVDLVLPAGTILQGRFTAIQLESGCGIGYTELDGLTGQ